MTQVGGVLILIGIAWFLACGYLRWHHRRKQTFPTTLSFWVGLVGPTGCLVCCAVALVLLILAIMR